jgi:hypothetical protein
LEEWQVQRTEYSRKTKVVMKEVEVEEEYGRRGKVDWVVVVPKGLYIHK